MKVEFMVGDSIILKDLLSAIYLVSDEVNLKAEDDGLRLFAVDYSRVAAIDVKISSGFFEEFVVEEKGDVCFGISDLVRCLRNVKRGYSAKIILTSEKIQAKLDSSDGGSERIFVFPVYEHDPSWMNLPNFGHKALIRMPVSIFRETIQDLLKVGDIVKVVADDNEFFLEAGDQFSRGIIRFKAYGSDIIDLNVENPPAQSHYNLEWLDKLSKALGKVGDDLTIRFSDDKPAEFTADYPNLDVKLILAPIMR